MAGGKCVGIPLKPKKAVNIINIIIYSNQKSNYLRNQKMVILQQHNLMNGK
jgi:hypothetical protein